MEEKKLTDEEIVKELMNESNRGEWCELSFIDCVEVRVLKNAIDLIHRLQGEKKELQESADLFNDFNEKLNGVIAEQKAEIERLTASREIQINELHEKHAIVAEEIKQQSVKDTAKEILLKIGKEPCEHHYLNWDCEWFDRVCKEYGVEVE